MICEVRAVSPALSPRDQRMTLPRAGPLLPLFESLAPTLEVLKLHANKRLGGRIPGEIGKFTKLTKLSLDCCGLEGARALSTPAAPIEPRARAGPIPPEIGNLTELDWLQLHENKLTGARPRRTRITGSLTFRRRRRTDPVGNEAVDAIDPPGTNYVVHDMVWENLH